MKGINNPLHASARQAKIDWLLTNSELWTGWPLGECGNDPRHKSIVNAMKVAGLYSKSTYWADVHLYNLIVETRRQRRNASYGG